MTHRHVVEGGATTSFGSGRGRAAFPTSAELDGAAPTGTAVAVTGLGGSRARRRHPEVEEVIRVLSGTGERMVEDGGGAPILRSIRSGTTVFGPKAPHQSTMNLDQGPSRIVVASSPSGSRAASRRSPDFRLVSPARMTSLDTDPARGR